MKSAIALAILVAAAIAQPLGAQSIPPWQTPDAYASQLQDQFQRDQLQAERDRQADQKRQSDRFQADSDRIARDFNDTVRNNASNPYGR